MFTFDGPDGVQGWESDKKLCLDKVWAPSCGKRGLFSKAMVSVRIRTRVRVGLPRRKMFIFDGPDGVQGWESDEKSVFGQSFDPKCG